MFTYLQSPDLGGGFRNLLKIYFLLEKSSGFADGKGAAHALSCCGLASPKPNFRVSTPIWT